VFPFSDAHAFARHPEPCRCNLLTCCTYILCPRLRLSELALTSVYHVMHMCSLYPQVFCFLFSSFSFFLSCVPVDIAYMPCMNRHDIRLSNVHDDMRIVLRCVVCMCASVSSCAFECPCVLLPLALLVSGFLCYCIAHDDMRIVLEYYDEHSTNKTNPSARQQT
jgi:hypothetical protein